MSNLQVRLDEFKKKFESVAPPYSATHEAIETMHRATAEPKASGIEAAALKVGAVAPSFTLFHQDHAQVVSADLLREVPLVVSFFNMERVSGTQNLNHFRSHDDECGITTSG